MGQLSSDNDNDKGRRSLCGGKVTYSFLGEGVADSRIHRITIIISDVKR